MHGGQNFVLKHRPKRKRSERQRVGGREAGERRIKRGGKRVMEEEEEEEEEGVGGVGVGFAEFGLCLVWK